MKLQPCCLRRGRIYMEAGLDGPLRGSFQCHGDEPHEKASIENLGKPSTDKARMLDTLKVTEWFYGGDYPCEPATDFKKR